MGDAGRTARTSPVMRTRGYQQELLEESLRENIIIALDTGSGKTHIAVLRMKLETERQASRVSWFLAPTVALVEQQYTVIDEAIPVAVGMISGASEPNQWKDAVLWQTLLATHRIIVSTPQVLLDALLHGYIDLGRDIALMVFDEAHHATAKHPYNMIMQQFYLALPRRFSSVTSADRVRPAILGLTASPIYGGNVELSFEALERNLDCTIRSSRMNRDELAQHVHRPVFKHVLYAAPEYDYESIPSRNCHALQAVVDSMNIENDPYVRTLRAQLNRLQPGDERRRVDQTLSKTIHKQDTFTHRGLKDFARTAAEICMDLGEWAADWYVIKVIEQAQRAANPYNNIMTSWKESEKKYLLEVLSRVQLTPVSYHPSDIRASLKVWALVNTLVAEEADFRSEEELYSGLVFVTRRDAVIALAELLERLPETAQLFRVGCLLGSSASTRRHSFLDITREMVRETHKQTLSELRSGEKNLIIATAVAEEGLDIQACGSVIRFDLPNNVVAWAQSRGRARRRRSSFILMFQDDSSHQKQILQWEDAERRMMALYTDPSRVARQDEEEDEEDGDLKYTVASTGATLTLDSVTSHLNHFCSVLPNASYSGQYAVYDLDPPDYPEDWHSQQDRARGMPPYEGPWGATVTLPRSMPKEFRVYSTDRVHKTKRSAQRHAAFKAYVALHQAGLVNDNLLPLTSAIEPDHGEEVKLLIKEIEKRAGLEKVPLQMNPWAPTREGEKWWRTELVIEGLPPLHMLTKNAISELNDNLAVYVPGMGAVPIHLHPLGDFMHDEEYLERARIFTRRIFACRHHGRMKPDNTSFAYLFLPQKTGKHEPAWEERRAWMLKRMDSSEVRRLETLDRVNAGVFGQRFGYPDDVGLVRSNQKVDKPMRFLRWCHGPLGANEVKEILERYEGYVDGGIKYPVLQAMPLPRRTDFTQPLDTETQGLSRDEPEYLLPELAIVDLLSHDDFQYALLMPSVLRLLARSLTVSSFRENLLVGSPAYRTSLSLLKTALTAPVSEVREHYQRLETLGDCVLKYVVSIQLFADHPIWHEGYLARRKDHAVSNVQLAKAAISKKLYNWVIRDRFSPKKWRPWYLDDEEVFVVEEEQITDEIAVPAANETKKRKKTQELSTKVLADVVEALLGAAYEHDGFDLAVDCVVVFGLGLTWKKIPEHIDAILQTVEHIDNPPPQLALVEEMLGYTFTRKALLIQALTHASYAGELETMSYERLEFLGDCTLDMIVTDYLYHAPGKKFKPGYMHLYKESLVNQHLLAYFCLKTHTAISSEMPSWTPSAGVSVASQQHEIGLWRCLLHSSNQILRDQEVATTRFEKASSAIHEALKTGMIYPWAALTSLQAPKFFSDMVESLLGAVFIDSMGNLDAVRGVLRTLGFIDLMERIVQDEVDVLHPVSRLAIWVHTQEIDHELELDIQKTGGNVSCTVVIDGEEIVTETRKYHSKASEIEARFAAAEKAIKKLHVLPVDEEEEEEDAEEEDEGWGNVPEYDW
ncbi:P-loop containing nucleoside triphosphate hydrolase protein [Laetiporus sulphureus 93-53]|uniref:p-loop containing nucleoside triphosphate hydrolase protein n=1 Tax=Laetiporus sulphureus 93-53 TaxID=1314785 RepID=A0A165FP28_9APHY|nr:P-loop containing nucleoside triphosphate hydrolase protein [Laetiporus sulphureus 93-53]KZT09260.1 P-loop containing nucleoside triphosphate hydrolase protein [Laetiporus sulphureus 93-53]